MAHQYKELTPEQVHHFMENGYVVIKNAFSREKAAQWTSTMWIRLGIDANDKSTWDRERVHMPFHKRKLVADFSPKAWAAMQDLLGEDRIDENRSTWGDSFIVNFGTDDFGMGQPSIAPENLDNWHVDGDFFVHYLDSPEQALLVIPIFSDIQPRGGGTMISPDGIALIAKYLAAHPEGVLPTGLSFTPSTSTHENKMDDPGYWSHLDAARRCKTFFEMIGEVGDVVLMHPLMLHSASKNHRRTPRIITNPPVTLKEPFKFRRENGDEYSLVERKTLRELGLESFDFKITTERRLVVPARMTAQDKVLEMEKQRLLAAGLV